MIIINQLCPLLLLKLYAHFVGSTFCADLVLVYHSGCWSISKVLLPPLNHTDDLAPHYIWTSILCSLHVPAMICLYLQDCTYFTRKEILRWACSYFVYTKIIQPYYLSHCQCHTHDTAESFFLFCTIVCNSKLLYQDTCLVGQPARQITWDFKFCY